METLCHVLNRMFESRGYTYYKKMIDDYFNGDWDFNIKQLVEYRNIKAKVSPVFTSKGYRILRTRVINNVVLFEEEMKKYYNNRIIPLREIRQNKILAKKAFMQKWGFITEGNQICQKAQYNCEICPNFKHGCKIVLQYTNNNLNMKKTTKILELLYGNLCSGICHMQVKEGLKYL